MNLLMRNNNHITLITKYKCPDFIRNLIYKKYTIVITGDDTKNIMNTIDKYMYSVDYAFIRNHEVLEEMKSKPYLNRVIFYGLDCHMDGLKKMNNKFHSIITQSELLKKKLVKNNIDSEKIYIVQPIVFKYDFNLPKKNDNEIRFVYCGTLRDEENILEIIEEFQKIHKKRPEVVLKIVYGKIHGDVTFTRKVNEYIKNGVKGITFKHNLSHKDACYEIATSDIGICWRKNGWGDNGEVSTKVREYKMYGIFCISNISNIINNKLIISDNFTYEQFKLDNSYYYLPYSNKTKIYENIIKFFKPKLLLVDSFWNGCDFTWSKITNNEKFETIILIVRLCNKYGIKTYFWNKEDPISYHIWIKYAKLFDNVFTTDESCIHLYKSEGISANVLPFLGNPTKYNIIKYNNLSNDKILFAGSWYSKYKHRCIILNKILEEYKSKFVIFDRNYKGIVNNHERYMYPDKFNNNINPSVDSSQLNEYYKNYNYILNLNSITTSYSMCARRIFEVLLSGGYPISNYSNALDVIFSGYLDYLSDNCIIKKNI